MLGQIPSSSLNLLVAKVECARCRQSAVMTQLGALLRIVQQHVTHRDTDIVQAHEQLDGLPTILQMLVHDLLQGSKRLSDVRTSETA